MSDTFFTSSKPPSGLRNTTDQTGWMILNIVGYSPFHLDNIKTPKNQTSSTCKTKATKWSWRFGYVFWNIFNQIHSVRKNLQSNCFEWKGATTKATRSCTSDKILTSWFPTLAMANVAVGNNQVQVGKFSTFCFGIWKPEKPKKRNWNFCHEGQHCNWTANTNQMLSQKYSFLLVVCLTICISNVFFSPSNNYLGSDRTDS